MQAIGSNIVDSLCSHFDSFTDVFKETQLLDDLTETGGCLRNIVQHKILRGEEISYRSDSVKRIANISLRVLAILFVLGAAILAWQAALVVGFSALMLLLAHDILSTAEEMWAAQKNPNYQSLAAKTVRTEWEMPAVQGVNMDNFAADAVAATLDLAEDVVKIGRSENLKRKVIHLIEKDRNYAILHKTWLFEKIYFLFNARSEG